VLYCEVCITQLGTTRGKCSNPACEIACCPHCLRARGQEVFCVACAEALDSEQADAETD